MTDSSTDSESNSIADRLHRVISSLPVDEQKALLEALEKKLLLNQRGYARKPYFKDVDFSTEEKAYQEFIRDISPSGLFIETQAGLEVGQEIKILLSFPSQERPVKIIGEIVRTTDQGIGVKFKPKSPIVTRIIEDIVEKL
jgi:Tfp pilus assembly protein PilZ